MKRNRGVRKPSRSSRADRDGARPAPAQSRNPRCRVLLVDGHVILRLGLKALLNHEPDLDVVAEADTADEAVKRLATTAVDVVITDLALPGGRSGLEFVRELNERFPSVRTLVLTEFGGYEYARASFAAGAVGYTLKGASQSELLDAIRAVRRGERFVNPAVASKIIGDYLSNLAAPRNERRLLPIITKRERDVLTRVASGRENREIAAELGLSVWTIRKHRQNVMKKFALRNSAAITAFAISHGLVPPASEVPLQAAARSTR
jgi:two-component system, NarL family, response regulator NreC